LAPAGQVLNLVLCCASKEVVCLHRHENHTFTYPVNSSEQRES
jgi:hypothetical protein